MQVDHVFAIGDLLRVRAVAAVKLPATLLRKGELWVADQGTNRLDALAGSEDASRPDAENLVAVATVTDICTVDVARKDAARRLVAGAVGIIEGPVVLVVAQEADVIAKVTIGSRSADFDGRLMVEDRGRDAEVGGREARERTRLDDLVDEP